MSTLHFSLGQNFGKLITDIAREHLLYDLNPKQAVSTIADSFCGMSEDMAKDILIGRLKIEVEEDGQSINVRKSIPVQDEQFYLYEFIEERLLDIRNDAKEYYKALNQFWRKNGMGSLFNNGITINLSLSEFLLNALEDQEISLEDMPEYRFMRATKIFIEKSIKFIEMVRWCHETWGEDEVSYELTKIPYDLTKVIESLEYLKIGIEPPEVQTQIAKENLMNEKLDRYLNAKDDNERLLAVESGLVPTGPEEFFDGGWLSPNGKFYGLNGDYEQFIHIAIADNLKAHKRLPLDEDDDAHDAYQYLEENGWVKIHHNTVHFCKKQFIHDNKVNFITDEQLNFLKEWAKNHHNGFLKFGYGFYELPYTTFGQMDKFALNELF